MSWLSAENITYSGPSPDEQEIEFLDTHGAAGAIVLNAYNTVNASKFYLLEGDEYLFEAGKFLEAIQGRNLEDVSQKEAADVVNGTFRDYLKVNGIVTEEEIEQIAKHITGFRENGR